MLLGGEEVLDAPGGRRGAGLLKPISPPPPFTHTHHALPERLETLETPTASHCPPPPPPPTPQALRERLGLTGWGDKFMVGVVSRLTDQKGTHLIKHAAFRATERGGQFVLLGSAPDPKVQVCMHVYGGGGCWHDHV